MKNRIWKKILAVGVSLLAEAGMLVGCTAQPAVAYGAEMEGGLSVGKMKTRNMKIYSAVEIRTGAWKMINMIFRMKQYLIQHLTNW